MSHYGTGCSLGLRVWPSVLTILKMILRRNWCGKVNGVRISPVMLLSPVSGNKNTWSMSIAEAVVVESSVFLLLYVRAKARTVAVALGAPFCVRLKFFAGNSRTVCTLDFG